MEKNIRVVKTKISGDITYEEFEKLFKRIAPLAGDENIRANYDKIAVLGNEKLAIKEKIEPFYTRNRDNYQKINELIAFAKYIIKSNSDIKIMDCPIRPDFIINEDNKPEGIGVEVTEIVDHRVVNKFGFMRNVLSKVMHNLTNEYPDFKGAINVYFNPDEFSFKNKKEIIAECTEMIKTVINGDGGELKYLKLIGIEKENRLLIEINESYYRKDLPVALVNDAVNRKEKLVAKYKAEANLEKVYLFIAIEGASEMSDYEIDKLQYTNTSSFDKIILFNSFKGKYLVFDKA